MNINMAQPSAGKEQNGVITILFSAGVASEASPQAFQVYSGLSDPLSPFTINELLNQCLWAPGERERALMELSDGFENERPVSLLVRKKSNVEVLWNFAPIRHVHKVAISILVTEIASSPEPEVMPTCEEAEHIVRVRTSVSRYLKAMQKTTTNHGWRTHSQVHQGDLEILVVDDDEINSYILDDMMKRTITQQLPVNAKLSVVTCSSGQQALSMIEERGYLPDLMLLDLMMPIMSGINLLSILQSKYPRCNNHAIMVTADSRSERECIAAGSADFISKPIVENGIMMRIAGVFDKLARAHKVLPTEAAPAPAIKSVAQLNSPFKKTVVECGNRNGMSKAALISHLKKVLAENASSSTEEPSVTSPPEQQDRKRKVTELEERSGESKLKPLPWFNPPETKECNELPRLLIVTGRQSGEDSPLQSLRNLNISDTAAKNPYMCPASDLLRRPPSVTQQLAPLASISALLPAISFQNVDQSAEAEAHIRKRAKTPVHAPSPDLFVARMQDKSGNSSPFAASWKSRSIESDSSLFAASWKSRSMESDSSPLQAFKSRGLDSASASPLAALCSLLSTESSMCSSSPVTKPCTLTPALPAVVGAAPVDNDAVPEHVQHEMRMQFLHQYHQQLLNQRRQSEQKHLKEQDKLRREREQERHKSFLREQAKQLRRLHAEVPV